MIDKNAGAEREKIKDNPNSRPNSANKQMNTLSGKITESTITAPSTDLAKKYEGYKYSISPLKQTNETIMVFRKPYKSGSCLHDTLAFENGDNECRCGALNIDGNRVGTETIQNGNGTIRTSIYEGNILRNKDTQIEVNGRYPSQIGRASCRERV